ncbi:14 kDa zinc-binding protein-like [Iris pallida]|uniref:14 kDa zinc-binding protein-like n=1 Tax=Iris pallida TaxID=29817 RepID=A0AAX6EPV0_IRIPA|nr:14 kDa zinc-binding protein-like [Iris pallida]
MDDDYKKGGSVSSRRLGVLTSHFNFDTSYSSSSSLLSLAAVSEKEAALSAVPTDGPTIFDKIIKKEIPSTVVYEDDKALAFRDINPQAPTHILVIPKIRDGLTGLSEAEERHIEILGYLIYVAKLVAKQEGLEDGYRIVINDGPNGCQSVYHLHIHIIGGRQMNWPPG